VAKNLNLKKAKKITNLFESQNLYLFSLFFLLVLKEVGVWGNNNTHFELPSCHLLIPFLFPLFKIGFCPQN